MSASEDDKPSGYIENGMTRSEAMEMYLELELRGKRCASRTAGIEKEGGALLSDRPPVPLTEWSLSLFSRIPQERPSLDSAVGSWMTAVPDPERFSSLEYASSRTATRTATKRSWKSSSEGSDQERKRARTTSYADLDEMTITPRDDLGDDAHDETTGKPSR